MALKFIGRKFHNHGFYGLGFIQKNGIISRQCSNMPDYHSEDICEDSSYIGQKCVNEVRLIGLVGNEPKKINIIHQPFTSFSLATNKYYRDESGSLKQITSWHNIVVKNPNLQNYVDKYVVKGSRTYVSGYITYREVADGMSGASNYFTSIVAQQVICLKKPFAEQVE